MSRVVIFAEAAEPSTVHSVNVRVEALIRLLAGENGGPTFAKG
jgi:hypothetical protein